jgi:hypothetical protein
MKRVWDKMGIAISGACVVHCIMVAFLPLIFPALAIYTHLTWIHQVVAVAILFTSPLAFLPGYRRHGLTWIITAALTGIAFIGLGYLMEGKVTEQLSHGITIMGSLGLVFAHAKNIQHSHRHQHQCC